MTRCLGLVPALLVCAVLAGCAAYGGRGLVPGRDSEADVLRTMGQPAMTWRNEDGSVQMSYPRGPGGYHSFMVFLDSQGNLQEIRNVMDMASFSRIRKGMSQAEVLRILGPSEPAWTAWFPARRELVWEWRYCDDWSYAARFDVLFDGDSGLVRTTQTWREVCFRGSCPCGR